MQEQPKVSQYHHPILSKNQQQTKGWDIFSTGPQKVRTGHDFKLWVCQFYNEMVEKTLHQHFTYDDESQNLVTRVKARNNAPAEKKTVKEKELAEDIECDGLILARSYLIMFLVPHTARSLSAFKENSYVGILWEALLAQCRSKNTHTIREVYQQIINIKMSTTEILISYQGRIQELILRLDGTDYKVSETHKWGILTRELLDVYKLILRTINVFLAELHYASLIIKLQELTREDFGVPNVALKIQRKEEDSGTALNTIESNPTSTIRFSDRCHWFQNIGHRMIECRSKLKKEPRKQAQQDGNEENATVAQERESDLYDQTDFSLICTKVEGKSKI